MFVHYLNGLFINTDEVRTLQVSKIGKDLWSVEAGVPWIGGAVYLDAGYNTMDEAVSALNNLLSLINRSKLVKKKRFFGLF